MSGIATLQWVVAGMPAVAPTGVVASAYGAVDAAAVAVHNGTQPTQAKHNQAKPFGTRPRFTVAARSSAPPPS